MKRRDVFPFTAIIGQDMLKLALELNVINPRLGGVLIQGEKGTAKSTAVRALADLLPPRKCIDGCRYPIGVMNAVKNIRMWNHR